MNTVEAAELLAMIKTAYPSAYRDLDKAMTAATIKLWARSFPDVPLEVMEQAFNHYKFVSKFPPTVSEMTEELREINRQAQDGILVSLTVGNHDMAARFRVLEECTRRFKNNELGRLDIHAMPALMGGRYGEENGPAQPGCYGGIEGRNELWALEGPSSAY